MIKDDKGWPGMTKQTSKFSSEVRERAVQIVFDRQTEHGRAARPARQTGVCFCWCRCRRPPASAVDRLMFPLMAVSHSFLPKRRGRDGAAPVPHWAPALDPDAEPHVGQRRGQRRRRRRRCDPARKSDQWPKISTVKQRPKRSSPDPCRLVDFLGFAGFLMHLLADDLLGDFGKVGDQRRSPIPGIPAKAPVQRNSWELRR